VGTDCTAVRYDWLVLVVQLSVIIGGYRLYSIGVRLVGIDSTAVWYVLGVLTVKLCGWFVGTNFTGVRYDWWGLTVQLCGMIGGY